MKIYRVLGKVGREGEESIWNMSYSKLDADCWMMRLSEQHSDVQFRVDSIDVGDIEVVVG